MEHDSAENITIRLRQTGKPITFLEQHGSRGFIARQITIWWRKREHRRRSLISPKRSGLPRIWMTVGSFQVQRSVFYPATMPHSACFSPSNLPTAPVCQPKYKVQLGTATPVQLPKLIASIPYAGPADQFGIVRLPTE